MTRSLRGAFAITCAAGLAACGAKPPQTAPIQTVTVERRNIVVAAEATGKIEPVYIVEIKSRASGQIIKMPVETGTIVKPGDLIVQLDTRDVQNQFDQAKADLDAAKARFDVAAASRKRSEDLFKAKVITSQELESSSLEWANAQTQVIRSETNLDLAKQRLEDATVRAPSAGVIIDKLVSLGTVILSATNSAGGGTTLVKMADLSKVRARVLITETDIGQVVPGLPATVSVDAFPNRPFRGVVEKIEPQAVVEQNVTMFPILVSLENEDGALKPGMNGEVSILVDTRESVIAVPLDAVRTAREAEPLAPMFNLTAADVQAAVQRGVAGGNGGNGNGNGAQAEVARGVLAETEQGGQGGRGAPVQTTPEQCKAVTDAFAKNPAAQKQLDDLRAKMRVEGADRQAITAEMRAVYTKLGVDMAVASACQRAANGGAPNGARGGQGAAPGTATPGGAATPAVGGRNGGLGVTGRARARQGVVFVMTGIDSTDKKNIKTNFEPRLVMLGLQNYDFTEVTAGLKEGEAVALLGAAAMQVQRNAANDRIRQNMQGPIPGAAGGAGAGGGRGGPGGGAPSGGGGGGGGGRGGQY